MSEIVFLARMCVVFVERGHFFLGLQERAFLARLIFTLGVCCVNFQFGIKFKFSYCKFLLTENALVSSYD
jgi:hypothetical protein